MKLKTLFNKSLVKSDFKRFWWISALYMFFILVSFIYPFMESARNSVLGVNAPQLYSGAVGLYAFSMFIPVITGVLLFSYLQTGKPAVFFHSINLTRKQNFCSRLYSGLVLITIPVLVTLAVMTLFKFNPYFSKFFLWRELFGVIITAYLYALITFSVSVFTSMIVGNTIASIFFTYVFSALPIMTEGFILYLKSIKLYGFTNESYVPWVLGKIYLLPKDLRQVKGVLIYLIGTVLILVASYFIYKARNLENHSEVVAFKGLKPVFVYGCGIVMGCVGFMYFNSFYGYSNLLFLLPFGIIAIVAAKMISEKSFKVPKIYKPCGIYAVLVLLVFFGFKADILGFERRVPKADRVSYITFDVNAVNDYTGYVYTDSDGKEYTMSGIVEADIADEEGISNVINLHKEMIDNRPSKTSEANENPVNFTITYTYKSGKKLTRSYTADAMKQEKYLKPVVESDGVRKKYFPILSDNKLKIESVSVTDTRISENEANLCHFTADSKKEYEELLNALKKDLKNAKYSEYVARSETFTRIDITYKPQAKYKNGTNVPYDKAESVYETYYVRPSYTNTLKVLEKYGYSSKINEILDEIEFVGIDYYNMDEVIGESRTETVNGTDFYFQEIVKDRETIEKLYNEGKNNKAPITATKRATFVKRDGSSFGSSLK